MKPAMYIFINEGLEMSLGKTAAQAAHAAVEAYRLSCRQEHVEGGWVHTGLVNQWYKGGHYTKLVMQARNAGHLRDIERYLNDRGFKTALVIDEGHTEVPSIVPTALGVEIVDRDDPHTSATFSTFKTLKPPKRTTVYSPNLWERVRLVFSPTWSFNGKSVRPNRRKA